MKEEVSFYPPWKELLKEAQLWEYGILYSHETIAKIVGLKKQSAAYYQTVSKANEELVLMGKLLEVVSGKGYRVINPDEYIRSSNDKVRQAIKHDRIGLIRILNSPLDKMDPASKKRTEEHAQIMSRRHSMITQTARPLIEIEQEQAKRMLNTEKPRVLISGD